MMDSKKDELKAGVAKVNITPPVGICQAGFSSREGKPSVGIHDDLYAKALVLEKNKTKLALLTMDILGIDEKNKIRIEEMIYKQTGIKNVFLCATHNHSGPMLSHSFTMSGKHDPSYTDVFCKKVAGAVYMAANNMTPVKIKYGIGQSQIGINRRPKDKNGKVRRIGENPNGPVDTDVPIFVLEKDDGTLLAILVNYACHAVACGDSLYISADYPGYVQRYIEDKLGCVVLFTQGAGANVNPMGISPLKEGFPTTASFELAQTHGLKIGEAVLSTLKRIKKYESQPSLKVISKKIPIPLRKKLTTKLYQLRRENSLRIKGENLFYEIHLLQIGGCLFVILEGEIFVEIGLEIKRRIFSEYRKDIKQIFIIGYSGNTTYYIPTPDAFKEGGYECENALLTEEAGDMIIESVVKMAKSILS